MDCTESCTTLPLSKVNLVWCLLMSRLYLIPFIRIKTTFTEQLKARLNLNMDNIVKLSEDELKAEVDSAVGQIINPLKMKNHLVGQLKTQITDLEMFIQFLQSETSTLLPTECDGCG